MVYEFGLHGWNILLLNDIHLFIVHDDAYCGQLFMEHITFLDEKAKRMCVQNFPSFCVLFYFMLQAFPYIFHILEKCVHMFMALLWNQILHYGMYVYMYLCMSSSIIWSSTFLIIYTCKCLSHNALFLFIFLVFVCRINSVFQLFGHQICGCF